jgi:cellulose synthase/poly-beta-1,6-N-acetylglucosamine synthase-like glycosyltransferase
MADTTGSALLAVGWIHLMLAFHPFTTYPLSQLLLARWRPRPVALASGVPEGTRAAMCICAYNEERVIRAKIENMLLQRESVPDLELHVYVDGATDATAEIVREYEPAGVSLITSPVRTGKTHGMNTLVALTDADWIIFSDANVEFAPDALPRLLAPFADPGVGCVCGHLVYRSPAGHGTAETGALYWRLEEAIKADESATGSVMGADGSIFALRRSLHVPPPRDLIDDFYTSLSVLCAGYRVVRVADAVAYEEAVSRPAEEFQRKIRIACQAFNVHRALSPQLRRLPLLDLYKYVSHKLLRWLAIFLLLIGTGLFTAGAERLIGWPVLVGLAATTGLTAAAMRQCSALARVFDILAAFVATGIGVLFSLRGERYQTWDPPASARAMPAVPAGAGADG